jgi:two-component system response regulator HydG
VVTVKVPPLRNRSADIPLLADFFLGRYAQKNHRNLKGIHPRTMDLLLRHGWPGNVRELENVVERGVIMAGGDRVGPEDLPGALRENDRGGPAKVPVLASGRSLKEVEKEMILKTLEDMGGNRTHTAAMLGISRRTLQLKLKEYGIN